MRLTGLIAGLMLALPATALAQQTPPETPPATIVDDVEVVGRPLRQMIESFVDEVVAPPRGKGIARWDRKVCVGVINLRADAAQAMADRISQVAMDVGLDVGEPGCSPNILAIATDDGAALARALVEASPNAFRPNYSGASRSSRHLERFQTREDAVRWWHVSMPIQRDTGQPAVRLPGRSAPIIANSGGLLTTDVRDDLLRSYVIIEIDKVAGLNIRQLSDYVAMTALAQIDPDADLRAYPTVLNVMHDHMAAGLTDWDRDYLASLYGSELNQRGAAAQGGNVASLMVRRTEAARAVPQTTFTPAQTD